MASRAGSITRAACNHINFGITSKSSIGTSFSFSTGTAPGATEGEGDGAVLEDGEEGGSFMGEVEGA